LRRANEFLKRLGSTLMPASIVFNQLGNVKFVAGFDCTTGFSQVEVEKEHQHKIAFSLQSGEAFEYERLCFGLATAPLWFQKAMDLALADLKYESNGRVICYVDDLWILAETEEELLMWQEKAFAALRAAEIVLKPSKAKILETKCNILGVRFDEGHLKIE